MSRPRVLLTGFGPFPGVADNPSGWLAETLAAADRPDSCTLYRAVFPTEWDTMAERVAYLHQGIRPRLMIHFGVSTSAQGLRLERAAHNRIHNRRDACGARPSRSDIMAGKPERLETRLPVADLAAQLRADGQTARVSNTCGRYLCNDLYYRSLHWTAENGGDALFVHVPLTRAQGGTLAADTLLRACETVLHAAVEAVARSDRQQRTVGTTAPIQPGGTR